MVQVKTLLIIVLALLFLVCVVTEGFALGGEKLVTMPSAKLPRTFERARLGMGRYDLSEKVQEGRRNSGSTEGEVVTVRPKDPYVRSVQYQFHHGVLREIAIAYKSQRVPGGHQGLLSRLKDTYGQPIAENQDEYDLRPDVLTVRKTVWEDEATKMVLTNSRRLANGDEIQELVLTITDKTLQGAYEAEQNQHYRQKVGRVPIPLSESARYQ